MEDPEPADHHVYVMLPQRVEYALATASLEAIEFQRWLVAGAGSPGPKKISDLPLQK